MTVEPSDASGFDPPLKRVVTVRRRQPLRLGASALSIGFLLGIVGGLLILGDRVVQVAAGPGTARVGNSVTFDAEARDYSVTLIADPTTKDFVESHVAQLECTVEHSDGTTEELDPSKALVRTSTPLGVFAVGFKGRPGPTKLTCVWGGSSDLGGSYAVATTKSAVKVAGLAALAAGVALGVAGIAGIAVGIRGRAELQDIKPGEVAEE